MGCLGERVSGCLAAMAPGQPAVASLGSDDLGQVADVVLAAAVDADGRPQPDQVGSVNRRAIVDPVSLPLARRVTPQRVR